MADRQPYLHDQLALLAAPLQVWSHTDGTIGDSSLGESSIEQGAVGVVFADVQLLSGLCVSVDGQLAIPIAHQAGAGWVSFTAIPRGVQDESVIGPDPLLVLNHRRSVVGTSEVVEHLELCSDLREPVEVVLAVDITPATTPIDQVKRGLVRTAQPKLTDTHTGAHWGDKTAAATLTVKASSPTGLTHLDQHRLRVSCGLTLAPGDSGTLTLTLHCSSAPTTPLVATPRQPWHPPLEDSGRSPWLRQALDDLDALRLEHRESPGQPFFAAGAPWYLTLFGRDSLWAARLLGPLGQPMAVSTLRVLADLQGRRTDPTTEEAPGKILHEIRSPGFTTLPTRYYGSIDATSLWVNLLVETWQSGGLGDNDLAALLPALTDALGWITGAADSDGDGFAEYTRPRGRGLANQGWKDSPTAIQYADGTQATGPIALTEVQAYAYQAAHASAHLLRHAGINPDRYLTWAEHLRRRYHQHFLLPDGLPALALDRDKKRVDATTSNIGHLLGTGLLDPDQEQAVAERLIQPDMNSGLGLRTLATSCVGYQPLSYHCGSVWAHDTAIVIDGMLRADLPRHAETLARGLAAAADAFDHRLPELWSGHTHPLPYPAACRPQAWAAAAAVPALRALHALPETSHHRPQS